MPSKAKQNNVLSTILPEVASSPVLLTSPPEETTTPVVGTTISYTPTDPPNITSQAPPTGNATHKCSSGWSMFNNTCWQHVDKPLNWTSARNHCLVSGGDLASIHSEEENQFACTVISKITIGVATTAASKDKCKHSS